MEKQEIKVGDPVYLEGEGETYFGIVVSQCQCGHTRHHCGVPGHGFGVLTAANPWPHTWPSRTTRPLKGRQVELRNLIWRTTPMTVTIEGAGRYGVEWKFRAGWGIVPFSVPFLQKHGHLLPVTPEAQVAEPVQSPVLDKHGNEIHVGDTVRNPEYPTSRAVVTELATLADLPNSQALYSDEAFSAAPVLICDREDAEYPSWDFADQMERVDPPTAEPAVGHQAELIYGLIQDRDKAERRVDRLKQQVRALEGAVARHKAHTRSLSAYLKMCKDDAERLLGHRPLSLWHGLLELETPADKAKEQDFKVGDRVAVVAPPDGIPARRWLAGPQRSGPTGTVAEVDDPWSEPRYFVDVDVREGGGSAPRPYWVHTEALRLLPQAPAEAAPEEPVPADAPATPPAPPVPRDVDGREIKVGAVVVFEGNHGSAGTVDWQRRVTGFRDDPLGDGLMMLDGVDVGGMECHSRASSYRVLRDPEEFHVGDSVRCVDIEALVAGCGELCGPVVRALLGAVESAEVVAAGDEALRIAARRGDESMELGFKRPLWRYLQHVLPVPMEVTTDGK